MLWQNDQTAIVTETPYPGALQAAWCTYQSGILKGGNIKDPVRPQSNTEADLLADFCTLVLTQKCQSVLKLVW